MLPEGWRTGQVSDLFKSGGMVTDGDWIESKDQDPNGNIRLVQLADVGDGHFVDKSNRFINNETSERLKCTILREGDVLVARMPDPIGRACLFPTNQPSSITAVDVCIMRPGSSVSAGWLMYLMNSPAIRRDIEAMASGTTRQRVTKSALLDLSIPIPPLPEQRRITEILGSIDAAIEATKEVIEQTKTVKQGLLQTLLTRGIGHTEFKDSPLGEIPEKWEVRPLGACFKNIDSRRKPVKKDDRAKMRGSIPYYGASGIIDWVNDFLFDEPLLLLAEDGANLLSKSTPIAFVATGQTWVNNHAHVYQPTGVLDVGLAEEWLCHADIVPFITGSAQPKLNKDKADSIPMPIPPVAEQKAINSVIQSINVEVKVEEAKLSSLQALKNGLMSDLLTGKVRATDAIRVAA